MDWHKDHYDAYKSPQGAVEFADIGCGYGGLLVALAPLFPKTRMLGMEIRVKVCEYVKQRIEGLRAQHEHVQSSDASSVSSQDDGDVAVPEKTHPYYNIAVLRTNSMKTLPHFFKCGQLSKMFFLFPDPHFKRKKHKARIISPNLLAEYAYFLRVGGWMYLATDVEELFQWMVLHAEEHVLFRRLPEEAYKDDPVVHHVLHSTEEGKKVERNQGVKFIAIFERIANPVASTSPPISEAKTT